MGLRRELVTEIEQAVGTEKTSLKRPELSAKTTHKIYEEITGEDAQPFEGKAWHIRKVFDELDIECYKSFYGDYTPVPTRELKMIKQSL